MGKCKCTSDVSTSSVVADNKSLIVSSVLVVNHAAAQLLRVRPGHLGVVTRAIAEPGAKGVRLLYVMLRISLHKGVDACTVKSRIRHLIIPGKNIF